MPEQRVGLQRGRGARAQRGGGDGAVSALRRNCRLCSDNQFSGPLRPGRRAQKQTQPRPVAAAQRPPAAQRHPLWGRAPKSDTGGGDRLHTRFLPRQLGGYIATVSPHDGVVALSLSPLGHAALKVMSTSRCLARRSAWSLALGLESWPQRKASTVVSNTIPNSSPPWQTQQVLRPHDFARDLCRVQGSVAPAWPNRSLMVLKLSTSSGAGHGNDGNPGGGRRRSRVPPPRQGPCG